MRVPSVDEEDARQLHRTRETVQQDRNRLIYRLKGLMTTQGLTLPVRCDFPTQLETAQLWDGTPIPAGLKARLQRVWAQLAFLNRTLEELDAERAALTPDPETTMGRYVHALADAARDRPGRHVDVGHRDLWLAADPEPAATGRLGGPGARPLSERRERARSRHHARRQ